MRSINITLKTDHIDRGPCVLSACTGNETNCATRAHTHTDTPERKREEEGEEWSQKSTIFARCYANDRTWDVVTRRERVNESEKGKERERERRRRRGGCERVRGGAADGRKGVHGLVRKYEETRRYTRATTSVCRGRPCHGNGMAWQLPCGAALGPAADVILSLSTGKLILISGKRAAFQDSWDEKRRAGKEGEKVVETISFRCAYNWVRRWSIAKMKFRRFSI